MPKLAEHLDGTCPLPLQEPTPDIREVVMAEPFLLPHLQLPDPFPSDVASDETSECSVTSTAATSTSSLPDLPSPFKEDGIEFFDESIDPPNSTFSPATSDMGGSLIPGSPLSVVQAVAILLACFTSFPISKEAFSRLLFLMHTFLLPTGNALPACYSAAISLINPFLLPVRDYHCCVNDCIIYRNTAASMYKDLTECPVCKEPRYHLGTSIPQKRFKYISPIQHLARMFGNAVTSQLLQSHHVDDDKTNETIASLHESPAWKGLYGRGGIYENNPRSVSQSLCLDGVNPFAKERTTYSMWPMTLVLLNLPQTVRMSHGSFMLAGIIPGKDEPKSTDPYLQVLVDDLVNANTLTVYDGFRNESFQLQGRHHVTPTRLPWAKYLPLPRLVVLT